VQTGKRKLCRERRGRVRDDIRRLVAEVGLTKRKRAAQYNKGGKKTAK